MRLLEAGHHKFNNCSASHSHLPIGCHLQSLNLKSCIFIQGPILGRHWSVIFSLLPKRAIKCLLHSSISYFFWLLPNFLHKCYPKCLAHLPYFPFLRVSRIHHFSCFVSPLFYLNRWFLCCVHLFIAQKKGYSETCYLIHYHKQKLYHPFSKINVGNIFKTKK